MFWGHLDIFLRTSGKIVRRICVKICGKFAIFRTNCAILTTHTARIHALISWVHAWVLQCGESCEIRSLADFSRRCQGITQGIRARALICSFN